MNIVEKLRSPDISWSPEASCVSAEVAEEGAAEIDRLQQENDRLGFLLKRILTVTNEALRAPSEAAGKE